MTNPDPSSSSSPQADSAPPQQSQYAPENGQAAAATEEAPASTEQPAGEQAKPRPRPRAARRNKQAAEAAGPWKGATFGLGALSLILIMLHLVSGPSVSFSVPSPNHSSPEELAKSWAIAQQQMMVSQMGYFLDLSQAGLNARKRFAAYYSEDEQSSEDIRDAERELRFIRNNRRELTRIATPETDRREEQGDDRVVIRVTWETKRVAPDGDGYKIETDERSRILTCVRKDGRWVIEGSPRGGFGMGW